jgi:hypothetical protein
MQSWHLTVQFFVLSADVPQGTGAPGMHAAAPFGDGAPKGMLYSDGPVGPLSLKARMRKGEFLSASPPLCNYQAPPVTNIPEMIAQAIRGYMTLTPEPQCSSLWWEQVSLLTFVCGTAGALERSSKIAGALVELTRMESQGPAHE